MALRPSETQGPLNGILVLDLTHVLSGPYCTMLLGELGARVIRIEAPGAGDVARQLGPFVNGKSVYFSAINRGKECVALDLKSEAGRAIFRRLLRHADILVENFTPGVMDRLDLGWDRLHSEFPRLIYAAISGFGRTGPFRDQKSNDLIAQAMGGIMSLTGHPDGPPTRMGTGIGDMAPAVFAALGVCSALYHREQTGQGALIDISMMDCQIALLEHNLTRYGVTGEVPSRIGNRHPSVAPFGSYETADGQIIISTAIDSAFKTLAEILGRPDLPEDPRFATISDRSTHADALDAEIKPVIRTRTTDHWLRILREAKLRVAPVQNLQEVVDHPQTRARNMVVTVKDPVMGELIMQGNPIKMPAFPDPPERRSAPNLGEHNKRIMKELEQE